MVPTWPIVSENAAINVQPTLSTHLLYIDAFHLQLFSFIYEVKKYQVSFYAQVNINNFLVLKSF